VSSCPANSDTRLFEKLVPHFAGRDAFDVHLHKGEHERLLVALVAGEELRGEGPVTILGHLQGQRADAGVQLAGLGAVAVASPLGIALIGISVQMCRHLGFEHGLDHALDEDAEKIGIVGQDGMGCCCDASTRSVCHCVPPSIRFVASTDRGGRWLP